MLHYDKLKSKVKEHFKNELGEANTQKLFDDIEIPLLRVLAAMEKVDRGCEFRRVLLRRQSVDVIDPR